MHESGAWERVAFDFAFADITSVCLLCSRADTGCWGHSPINEDRAHRALVRCSTGDRSKGITVSLAELERDAREEAEKP